MKESVLHPLGKVVLSHSGLISNYLDNLKARLKSTNQVSRGKKPFQSK